MDNFILTNEGIIMHVNIFNHENAVLHLLEREYHFSREVVQSMIANGGYLNVTQMVVHEFHWMSYHSSPKFDGMEVVQLHMPLNKEMVEKLMEENKLGEISDYAIRVIQEENDYRIRMMEER